MFVVGELFAPFLFITFYRPIITVESAPKNRLSVLIQELLGYNTAIIGFNVLNKCEENIFKFLKSNYSVDFYWDYDEYYKKSDFQESGIFIKENLKNFPHNQDFAKNDFNTIINSKEKVNIIKTSFDNENAHYIKTWIKDLQTKYEKDYWNMHF